MKMTPKRFGFALVLIGTVVIGSAPANARGCNNVVNVFVWGCAPWDNNNGSQYPYFKKRAIAIPANQAQIQKTKEGNYVATYQGQTFPLISQDGGGLVASGAGNLVASGGGNIQVWSPN